jgi:hypothetical protein
MGSTRICLVVAFGFAGGDRKALGQRVRSSLKALEVREPWISSWALEITITLSLMYLS